MSRIAVFSLGGTIAMTPSPEGGVTPALSGAQLVEAIPGLDELGHSIEPVEFRRLPGASLSLQDIISLAGAIEQAIMSGAIGAVVVQGTDTIEETAFALDVMHQSREPLVITGAMRNPAMASPDGPANLLAALRTAASERARDLGCLVVLNDAIHLARWLRKMHTSSVDAFQSPHHGPIGHVIEGVVRIPFDAIKRATVTDLRPAQEPRVGVLPVVLGDDGELFKAVGESLDGLVVAAFGVGHVPEQVVPHLAELANRIPVVLASRTGAGIVHERTYGFAGSEMDLFKHGLINGGSLDPFKARILLYFLLASQADERRIRAEFSRISQLSE